MSELNNVLSRKMVAKGTNLDSAIPIRYDSTPLVQNNKKSKFFKI